MRFMVTISFRVLNQWFMLLVLISIQLQLLLSRIFFFQAVDGMRDA